LIYCELWQYPIYTMMVLINGTMGFMYHIASYYNISKRTQHHENARFGWNHSQNSPIMASQCFHSWLCPRGNQLHKVKSLPPSPFYLTNCQLCIIHVICPNASTLIVSKSTKCYVTFTIFPMLKDEWVWTYVNNIVHHPEALEYEAQQLFQMHSFVFSHIELSYPP
jgi:hypothetical protein